MKRNHAELQIRLCSWFVGNLCETNDICKFYIKKIERTSFV